jgi:hypothetical protein
VARLTITDGQPPRLRFLRGLAPIAAIIPVRMRIDSEHAVDASNDSTSRSADNPTNKATDRSEHAITGIGTAVCPVVHPTRHALRSSNRRTAPANVGGAPDTISGALRFLRGLD